MNAMEAFIPLNLNLRDCHQKCLSAVRGVYLYLVISEGIVVPETDSPRYWLTSNTHAASSKVAMPYRPHLRYHVLHDIRIALPLSVLPCRETEYRANVGSFDRLGAQMYVGLIDSGTFCVCN